uniref:Zinc finger HIT-type containing 3 n=1 Tax=Leptobrachium leishanense TaxID=445787 RepID=A0A8C5LLF6_9ANUR
MPDCCVCSARSPKYRCPGCRHRYCSVTCCKKHKDACVPITSPVLTGHAALPVFKGAESLQRKGDLLAEDCESDRIPENKLKLLGQSEELKQLLLNPHLRRLLITMDQSEKKEDTLKQYMQEPLFVEFADCCLGVIEPEEKENRFPE